MQAQIQYEKRLKILHVRTQKTWEELAKDLGLSVSMIYQVARGSTKLSAKAVYRLEQVERAAGIEPPPVTVEAAIDRQRTATEVDADFYKSENARLLLQDIRETLQKVVHADNQSKLREAVFEALGSLKIVIKLLTPLLQSSKDSPTKKQPGFDQQKEDRKA